MSDYYHNIEEDLSLGMVKGDRILKHVQQQRKRIEELEAKLVKAEALQEAQKLFNYYAVEIVTYGATVARLQNLENAWLNLKTQAELTGD